MKKDIVISLAALAAVALCATGMKQTLDPQNMVRITPQEDPSKAVYTAYANGPISNNTMKWVAYVECEGAKAQTILLEDEKENQSYLAERTSEGTAIIVRIGPSSPDIDSLLDMKTILSGKTKGIDIFNIDLCQRGKPTRNEATILSIPSMKYPSVRPGWE